MLLVAKTVKSIENLNAGIVLVTKCAFLLDKISHAWSKDTGTLQGKKFFLIHQSVTSNAQERSCRTFTPMYFSVDSALTWPRTP